eukprot:COSAG02_NODE_48028_length_336_cov_15.936709_1_plen_44_part_00
MDAYDFGEGEGGEDGAFHFMGSSSDESPRYVIWTDGDGDGDGP